jgi:hypothetical protein
MSYHWAGVLAKGITKSWPFGRKITLNTKRFIKHATKRWQRKQGKKLVEGL